MSGETDLVAAVGALGLLSEAASSIRIHAGSDWRPGGAETYIYTFSVSSPRETRSFILKAVTAMGPGGSVGAVAAEWLSRRNRLQSLGVSTPQLYAVHRATILEEYVPLSLGEALQLHPAWSEEFKSQCVLLAHRVAEAGFRPVALFHDLRSRGRDVVMIDFGEDLGSAVKQVDGSAALSRLEEFSMKQGWELDAEDREIILGAEERGH